MTARRAMPWVFVLIWSTGFVVARLAMPHAPPLKFLSVRFLCSALAFWIWIVAARVEWPRSRGQWLHLAATGVLMQTVYLGGVWAAVHHGMGAATTALLVGLQPVLTAVWVSLVGTGTDTGEGGGRGVTPRQWLGVVLGFAGLVLVVAPKLALHGGGEVDATSLGFALLALAGITVGTLYQKRFVAPCDVRSASFVQMVAAVAVSAPIAFFFEPAPIEWHRDAVVALAWSVGALTLGGSSLLYMLIQRGEATAVTSLLYLVPPCTALLAWWMFGEIFTPLMMAGLVLTMVGVAAVVTESREPRAAKGTP